MESWLVPIHDCYWLYTVQVVAPHIWILSPVISDIHVASGYPAIHKGDFILVLNGLLLISACCTGNDGIIVTINNPCYGKTGQLQCASA
ncbi:MAG: hypothetical protein ACI9FJ_002493 [Alteromonadaceae bacterium]|jgi:hypothetical protein